jgi:hypothetical protein
VPERVAGTHRAVLTERDVRRHRHHWSKRGLQRFWDGEGFTHDDRGQELSYELAHLLVSLLVGDHRDRVRPFLRAARSDDFGAAAARDHLGMTLGELATKFLGPGDWEPEPPDPAAADEEDDQ